MIIEHTAARIVRRAWIGGITGFGGEMIRQFMVL